MSALPEIFFHVGLGKVASTYLQHSVFPKLNDIRYIPTSRYKKSKDIIERGGHNKFLVSREFDRQFEREVRWFTDTYPSARIIILFRRHDSWVASQYRRYVKNGFYKPFDAFLDLEDDTGFWKKKDLLLFPKIRIIEECSDHRPLVLFHDELKRDPWEFVNKISEYTGTPYDKKDISLHRVHTSFSDKQLKVLRTFCQKYVKKVPKGYENKIKHWLLFRSWWAFFHLILYTSSFFPESWVPPGDLIDKDQLLKIRETYQPDWEKIVEYANRNNLKTE